MPLKANYLLAQNIRVLLTVRRQAAAALAEWCGHKPPWISKILDMERGVRTSDLDCIADFFKISVADLFRPGIAPLLERRRLERRKGLADRRKAERRERAVDVEGGEAPAPAPTPTPEKPDNGHGSQGKIGRQPNNKTK